MTSVRVFTVVAVLLTSRSVFAQRAPVFPADRYLRGWSGDDRPGPTLE